MKSIFALSALVASAYAGLADDWFAQAVTLDEGVEANWDQTQTGTWIATGSSVQVSAKATQSVSGSGWGGSTLDITWFTYQELDGALMLWGSIETSLSNGSLAKGDSEDTWAAIGSSTNDQIVCQWNNLRDGNDYEWSVVGVYDYFQGSPDTTENNITDQFDQSAATNAGALSCVFQRPVYNTDDPTEDLSLVGDLTSIPANFVQGGSYGSMTEGTLEGTVIDLDYVS